jgi:hypothetical protein
LETSFSSPFVWLSHIWQERGYLFFTSFTRNSYVCLYGRQAVNSKYFTIHACIPQLCMYLLVYLSFYRFHRHFTMKGNFLSSINFFFCFVAYMLCCTWLLILLTTYLTAKREWKHFRPTFIFIIIFFFSFSAFS